MVEEENLKESVAKSGNESTPKAEKQNKVLGMILFFSLIILILIAIFLFRSSSDKIEQQYFTYNGIKFTPNKKAGIGFDMEFYVNDAQFPIYMSVREDPRNLEDISIDIETIKGMLLDRDHIYVLIDPEDDLKGATTVAAQEIDYFIDNPYLFNIPVSSAFFSVAEDSVIPIENQTVKDCSDASEETGLIWLRLGNSTSVFEENGCVVVQGKSPDEMEIIRAADRFYLTMIGIMR